MIIDRPKAFIHIPKTAGTSLVSALKEKYAHVVSYYPPKSVTIPPDAHLADLLVGHYAFGFEKIVFDEQKPFLFTFLRSPVKRFISQLKFDAKYYKIGPKDYSKSSIDEYISNKHLYYLDNCLVRYISGIWNNLPIGSLTASDLGLAKRNLELFDFIGDFDFYNSDLSKLGALLGVELTPYHENIGDSMSDSTIEISNFSHFIDLDIELYQYFLENFR